MPLIFGLILKLCLSRRCTRRCSLSFRSMGRSVFWDVSENRVSPPMQNCWFELSQKMLLIVLIIIILCLANLYTSCLLNRKIYAEMFNSSKRPVVFFDLSTENCVSNLLSHEMRVPRSSLIFLIFMVNSCLCTQLHGWPHLLYRYFEISSSPRELSLSLWMCFC